MNTISTADHQDHRPIRIFHVDDDSDFTDMVKTFLQQENEQFEIETAASVTDGLERLTETSFDCIVSDYDMPEQNGIEFLETVREKYPDLPFILYTGKGSEEVASDAISVGVTDYLQKGSGTDQYTVLANRISNAVSAHRATAEVEQTRQRLEQILKTVPACIVQLNDDGEFTFANERAVDVLGLEQSDVTERTYSDPEWKIRDLNGEPIPDEELPFWQVRDSGEPLYGYRHTIEWPDGTRKVLLVNGAPLFDEDGNVENVVFTLSDITDYRERTRDLQRSKARLEALFENSPDMIDVHDGDGTIIDVNARLCEETGYDEDDLLRMKVWGIDRTIEPDDVRTIWAEMEVGERRELEGVYQRRDGSTFPAKIHIRHLDSDEGDRFVVISRDISEQKERERDLERTREFFREAERLGNLGVWELDASGDVFWTEGARQIHEINDDYELTVESAFKLIHPDDRDHVRQIFEAALESGDPYDVELRIVTAEGNERWVHNRGKPIDSNGTGQAFRGFLQDITERKKREAELQRQNERLEEFASIISHDLRSPLSVAEGRLELAKEECDSEHLDHVCRAHERMNVLVDDLLTLAREGDAVGEFESINLREFVEDCWQTVGTADATLAIESDRTIQADRSRLAQLMENLMRNAVDHGGGDVTVTVGVLNDGFYVEDDGPGIPEEDREQIFESGYSTSHEGTGFGLAIVQAIVEAHSWDIRTTESEARGARFEITGVEFVE